MESSVSCAESDRPKSGCKKFIGICSRLITASVIIFENISDWFTYVDVKSGEYEIGTTHNAKNEFFKAVCRPDILKSAFLGLTIVGTIFTALQLLNMINETVIDFKGKSKVNVHPQTELTLVLFFEELPQAVVFAFIIVCNCVLEGEKEVEKPDMWYRWGALTGAFGAPLIRFLLSRNWCHKKKKDKLTICECRALKACWACVTCKPCREAKCVCCEKKEESKGCCAPAETSACSGLFEILMLLNLAVTIFNIIKLVSPSCFGDVEQ